MEVGYVYVFITYIKQLFEPITRIIENVEVVEEATVSMDKIYAILDKEEYLEYYEDRIVAVALYLAQGSEEDAENFVKLICI